MKIIFLSLLTLVMVSCNDRPIVGSFPREQDAGTFEWIPLPNMELETGGFIEHAYLFNTRNGELEYCGVAPTDTDGWNCDLALDSVFQRRAAESAANLDRLMNEYGSEGPGVYRLPDEEPPQ